MQTASGGRYLYFTNATPVKSGTNVLGPGVDIKSSGGYVVGPYSEIPGVGQYMIVNDCKPQPAPAWLLERLKATQPLTQSQAVTTPVMELDLDRNVELAIEYLRTAREAVSGAGGNDATYKVALDVKDLCISRNMCLDLMLGYWNEQKAFPAWDVEDLDNIVRNAYQYGRQRPGAKLSEAVFTAYPDDDAKALTAGRFTLEYACDLSVEIDQPYLIDGVLDLRGSSVIYGDTNCGKTFIALDMAYRVFLGLPWQGYKTRKGGVLYIATEGGIGIVKRLAAIRSYLPGADTAKVGIIRKSVDLFNSDADCGAVVKLIDDYEADTGLKCELLFLDTFARSLAGGNENTAQDVGTVLTRLEYIKQERNTHVCIVHHTGKDRREMRGSSALVAAVDNTLKITQGLIIPEKQRDEAKPPRLGFRLKEVVVGNRKEDNKPITSCVVEPVPAITLEFNKNPLPKNARIALSSLEIAIATEGIDVDDKTVAVSEETWWKYHLQELEAIPNTIKLDSKRRIFKRAQTTLKDKERIAETANNQWYIL